MLPPGIWTGRPGRGNVPPAENNFTRDNGHRDNRNGNEKARWRKQNAWFLVSLSGTCGTWITHLHVIEYFFGESVTQNKVGEEFGLSYVEASNKSTNVEMILTGGN